MRRPKLKSYATSFITIGQHHQMTPWDEQQQMNLKQNSEQIPTYRRQIMQKFLGNVHLKNNQARKYLSKRNSPEKKQNRKNSINLQNFQQLHRISKTQQSLDHSRQQNSYEYLKMKKQLTKKKKMIKATIINFDADFVRSQQQIAKQKKKTISFSSDKSFARKLLLKQSLKKKKNIETSLKYNSSSITPTSKTNPYYLYHYNKSLKKKDIKGQSLYCKASSLRKRPNSQQIIRAHQIHY